MTEEKLQVIRNFLFKHENKAFFIVEIIEPLKEKGITLKDLMEFIDKHKGKEFVYMESAEPFGEGVLLTWISQKKPLDRVLEEAKLRVKERKEELEAKALETAKKITSFVGRESLILDVGCGSGRLSIPLAEAGNTVVGLDVSKRQLLQAKNWTKKRNVKLDLVVGSMENLPF